MEGTNRDSSNSSAICLDNLSDELEVEKLNGEPTDLRCSTHEVAPGVDEQVKELREVRQQLAQARVLLVQKEARLARILGTVGWGLLNRFGPLKHRFVLPAYKAAKRLARLDLRRDEKANYRAWAAWSERLRPGAEWAANRIQSFMLRPRISIVMPVYNPRAEYLIKAIDSVVNQYYPDWELCICDDGSTAPHVCEVLDGYSSRDNRIQVTFSAKNEGIALATNRALKLATGEFVGFLDHDDELTIDALFEVVTVLQEVEADLIYSDEDKLDPRGHRCQPFFKPAWSPDLLLSTMYTCHFSVYRKQLIDQIGGLREGLDGSQDYDLALRLTERTDRIAHIPRILYHWRQVEGSAAASVRAKPYAYAAGKTALTDALRRRGIEGEVVSESVPGFYRVKRRIATPGKVTIVIPTRDRFRLLEKCIASIESNTDYDNFEIMIVDNGSKDRAALDYLARTPHLVIRDDGFFNFSRLNNIAARQSTGDYLLFLNDDTEVIASEWLSAMVEHAQRPEVGAVGAKLLYPNRRVQHAGVILGVRGMAGHSHRHQNGRGGFGYVNFPNIVRNYSAVTGACMMLRRDLFNAVGGFDERLAVRFNDVDLCLRLLKRGLMVVYTPYALLYHREGATRGGVNAFEESYLMSNWREYIMSDPYYNPNQSLRTEDFSVDYSKPESLYQMFAFELSDHEVQLTPGMSWGQEFIAIDDHLCAVGVRLATGGKEHTGVFRLHLRESHQSKRDLRLAEVDASAISLKDYSIFPFDSLRNSLGKTFYFFVDYLDGSGSLAALGKSSFTSDVIGPSFENHRLTSGTLSFRLYGQSRFRCSIGSRGAGGEQ